MLRYIQHATCFNFVESMIQRIHQLPAPLAVVQQIVLQIRVALHHPNIAQHFVQHARAAPCAPLCAQLSQNRPCGLAQKAYHNLFVRQRGVVIRDLANSIKNRVHCIQTCIVHNPILGHIHLCLRQQPALFLPNIQPPNQSLLQQYHLAGSPRHDQNYSPSHAPHQQIFDADKT